MSTTHFFLPLRGAGRWRRAAQEIHLTAGGARTKAAGKPRRRRIDAARRAGSENHGAAGLAHSGIVRSQPPPSHAPPSPSPTLPSPSPPPPSPSPTLPSLSPPASFPSPPPPSPSLPPPSPSRRHLATTIAIGIALAATAYATLSLAVAVAAFAFAFAFAAAAQPAQSASAALAALATVEGRGASLSFDRASSRRFDRCAERHTFSLRFWLKAPHKRHFFSRCCRPAPRGGPRSAFFTIPGVSGAHFGSTTEYPGGTPEAPAASDCSGVRCNSLHESGT